MGSSVRWAVILLSLCGCAGIPDIGEIKDAKFGVCLDNCSATFQACQDVFFGCSDECKAADDGDGCVLECGRDSSCLGDVLTCSSTCWKTLEAAL